MQNKKDVVTEITNMEDNFAQWYTDVVLKAELCGYTSVAGCIILRPYGYAIWELITKTFNDMILSCGHENIQMPMFIPESLLQKEKDHVEGFAPEVAWVTHGGSEELTERLCIRPTSETLFCEHYAATIQSYRDLPKLYNQWCSVVRWEKTTRPFLRNREFWWQEGHTAHATAEDAMEETLRMLDIYAKLSEEFLAMPVIKGQKTESEKFAGAESTYGIECMMHDGKALQAATSHYFGDGFAKAFDIQYTDKQNRLQYIFQTSWGMTTRLIGGVIMVHGDNKGLSLPPRIAPVQVIIVPVAQHKPGVLEKAAELANRLKKAGVRVKTDDSDKSPGWKFSEYEMKGVPIRIEIGPRDIEKNEVVMARRDTGEKVTSSIDDLETSVTELLEKIQAQMLERARQHMSDNTHIAKTVGDIRDIMEKSQGLVKAMWCGDPACEAKIKEQLAVTSRCVPFEQENLSETCVCCGKKAEKMVYWAKAY